MMQQPDISKLEHRKLAGRPLWRSRNWSWWRISSEYAIKREIFCNGRAFFSIIFIQSLGIQAFFSDDPAKHSTIAEKSLNAEAFYWKVAAQNCIVVVISVNAQALS